jgi:hypothetical protein
VSRLIPPQDTHRGGPEAVVAVFLGGSHVREGGREEAHTKIQLWNDHS